MRTISQREQLGNAIRKEEAAAAQLAKQKALLEYIAMISDIDIDTDDTEAEIHE